MGNELSIDALIGFGMPALIAVVNQSRWSPRVRAAVAMALCVLAATVAELVRGGLTWTDWRDTALVIFGAAVGFYRAFWQPSTLAATISAATDLKARRPPIES